MVRSVSSIKFQPSLIILADEVGNHIYQHLLSAELLNYLSEEQLHCIGFIQVTAGENRVLHWLANEKMMGAKEDSLEVAIGDMLPREKSIKMLQSAGYEVPRDSLQICIISDVHVERIDSILQLVEKSLNDVSMKVYINLVLGCSDSSRETARQRQQNGQIPFEAVEQLVQLSGITSCYIYGNLLRVRYTEQEIYYAAAEALFYLLVADITWQEEFKRAVQPRLDNSMYMYSTVNTCLIRFPSVIAREFCHAQIGLAVVDQWLKEISESPVPSKEVLNTLEGIKSLFYSHSLLAENYLDGSQPWWARWIRKDMPLASSASIAHCLWPKVDINVDAVAGQDGRCFQQAVYQQLHKETQQLFEVITFKSIQQSRKPFQQWHHVAKLQYSHARVVKQKDWRDAADKAWEDVAIEAYKLIETTLKELWNGSTGFAATVSYIDALDEELKQLTEKMSSEDSSDHTSIPDILEEEDIIFKERFQVFEDCIISEQEHLPTIAELFWLAIVSIGFLLPVIRLILRPIWHQMPTLLPILASLAISGLFVLSSLFAARKHYFQIALVCREIAHFCRCQHVEYCQKYEAKKRLDAVCLLRRYITCLKSTFLKEIKNDCVANIHQAIEKLFANVAASRDLFVGNGEYFSQSPAGAREALQKIANDILNSIIYPDQLQGNKQQEILPSCKEDLLQAFQAHLAEPAEMKKLVVQSIDKLSLGLIDNFLQKKLLGIRRTGRVVNEQLWEDVLRCLERSVSDAQPTDQQQRHLYLCGARKTIEWAKGQVEAIQREITPLLISQVEDWLLIATLSCCQVSRQLSDNSDGIAVNVVNMQPDPNR